MVMATELAPVRDLSASDEGCAVSTIVLAFATDPGSRWFSPTANLYMDNMAGYVRTITTTAIVHHSAYCTENCKGVAICLPPNVEPDEAAIADAIDPGFPDSAQAEMQEMSERSAAHRPSEPHWYLAVIGVDPGVSRARTRKSVDCPHV